MISVISCKVTSSSVKTPQIGEKWQLYCLAAELYASNTPLQPCLIGEEKCLVVIVAWCSGLFFCFTLHVLGSESEPRSLSLSLFFLFLVLVSIMQSGVAR